MDAVTATFHDLRPRLQGVAYRMLGSVSESEDVVQDVWLRWNATDKNHIDSAEAWLVAIATRLSIDRLRAARARREQYVGIRLPEAQTAEWPATPEDIVEFTKEVAVAFLAVLERLASEARAAFLLREVFDVDYDEVARTLGKSEATCRQIVHRARVQLRRERARHALPSEARQKLTRRFADLLAQGDFAGMKSMLAEIPALMGDGGGPGVGVRHASGRHVTHRPAPLRRRPARQKRAAHRAGERQRVAPHRRRAGIGQTGFAGRAGRLPPAGQGSRSRQRKWRWRWHRVRTTVPG
jgi:RNA polymerase sigma-70 factor (ECF subfamily)